MNELALLGDEAVAMGALHAGVSASYGYPGTPSTEIMERLIAEYEKGGPLAAWSTNEKTAMEAALGVSFAGRRSMVTMKHVGLNVAADPFINGALLGIKGGLVIAVADDPGMHSSQDEQDSRFYAAFAMVPCLEPRNQQEAYEMTREAFDLSERFAVPVLLRLTTRLSHARAGVSVSAPKTQNPVSKATDKTAWMLLPAYARKRYELLIAKQTDFAAWSLSHPSNKLEMKGRDTDFAVITSGLGGNYYEENLADFVAFRGGKQPSRLHIGAYPAPVESIRKLCARAKRVLLIEEGMPVLEEKLRGFLPQALIVNGKLDGTLPRAGELDPDNVRKALGLAPRAVLSVELPKLPGRPPQLCQGCPHGDSYEIIKQATAGKVSVAITADIGCYALGALPPYGVPETIVCMGASVNMAKGASDAGIECVIGVIGDSTFLHSGMTPLIDAVKANTPMTLVILDNSIVAMTGCQDTMLPSARLVPLLEGIGVNPQHIVVLEAMKKNFDVNLAAFKKEIEYRGLSVVVFRRECLEAFKGRQKKEKAKARGAASCEG
ncbi:MAG: thiamine pyrophosphate-dependent enzyme [Treponemataceae bacterium]